MATSLRIAFLMLCAAFVVLSCCTATLRFASAAEMPAVTDGRHHTAAPSTDSLGLAILREYKALEQQQQQRTVGGSGGEVVSPYAPDPYPPTYALGFPSATIRELQRMSNKDLRAYIKERGGRCDGCVEKVHLLERAIALRGVPTKSEEVVAMLTPYSTAAPTHLPTDILRPQTPEEIQQAHHVSLSHAVLKDPRYLCEVVQKQTLFASSGNAEGDTQQQHQPPEISCRPRTAEDADYV